MMTRQARTTLIARESTKPDVDWNYAACSRKAVAFVQSVASLRYALPAALNEFGLDIGRVIVDRAGVEEYMGLLTDLPEEFNGDAMLIRDDGTGFLSATARGGARVLYSLTPFDVRFYLEANDLVTGRMALEVAA